MAAERGEEELTRYAKRNQKKTSPTLILPSVCSAAPSSWGRNRVSCRFVEEEEEEGITAAQARKSR